MATGDEPQIGGQDKPQKGFEPALPLKTLKFPLRTHQLEWVLTPEDIESTPQPIEGHYYTLGFSRGERRGYLSIIDTSTHLLVAYHVLAQGLGGQIERTIEIANYWGRHFVSVDAGNGGEYLAEAIRSRGVSAMRGTPNTGQDIYHLLAALQDGRLIVYPDPMLFEALRSVQFVIDNRTGRLRLFGMNEDEVSLLLSVAMAWRLAGQPRIQLGIMY
jgi:hypothetical protein